MGWEQMAWEALYSCINRSYLSLAHPTSHFHSLVLISPPYPFLLLSSQVFSGDMKDIHAVEKFALRFQDKSICKALVGEAIKVKAGRQATLKTFLALTEAQVRERRVRHDCICDNLSLLHFSPCILPII